MHEEKVGVWGREARVRGGEDDPVILVAGQLVGGFQVIDWLPNGLRWIISLA